MSLPELHVELALSTRPREAPVWVDVTDRCDQFTISRGRSDEFGRVEAGRATVRLDNSDRLLDPTYSAGAYYGQLKRSRRLRLYAVWQGSTYHLFGGYIAAWPQNWPGPLDGYLELPAEDALAVLARLEVRDSYPEQLSGARVNAILNSAGWTTGQGWVLGSAVNGILGSTTILTSGSGRDVSEGRSYVQAADYTTAETKALDALRTAETAEDGLLFARADGALSFRGRLARLVSTSAAVFGDGGGDELPYPPGGLVVSDDGPIVNDCRVTVTGGSTQAADDEASQLDYFKQSLTLEAALGTSADPDALARAQWYVTRYKTPTARVRSLTLDPQGDDRLWPQVLARDLGDKITTRRRPGGLGDPLEVDAHIERIEHRFNLGDGGAEWTVRWELSPANDNTYWVLGNATLGVLGTTTRLAY